MRHRTIGLLSKPCDQAERILDLSKKGKLDGPIALVLEIDRTVCEDTVDFARKLIGHNVELLTRHWGARVLPAANGIVSAIEDIGEDADHSRRYRILLA